MGILSKNQLKLSWVFVRGLFGFAVATCDFNGDGRMILQLPRPLVQREGFVGDESGVLIYLGLDGDSTKIQRRSLVAVVSMMRANLSPSESSVGTRSRCRASMVTTRSGGERHGHAISRCDRLYVYSGTPTVIDDEYPEPGGLVEIPDVIYAGDEAGQGSRLCAKTQGARP